LTWAEILKVFNNHGFGGLDPPPPLMLPPPLPLLVPLPPLGGLLLPLLLVFGGVGLLSLGGGLLFVGGVGGDCVGQLALASITDPSGHVFVVGEVGGGVNDCAHEGSFGFFVQSTGGAIPKVQLFTHIDPAPDPPDAGIDVLVGCIAAKCADVVLTYGHVVLSLHVDGGDGVIPCSFASCVSQSLVLRFLSRSVIALLSARSHGGGGGGLRSIHL
jgi:hypothetical protein